MNPVIDLGEPPSKKVKGSNSEVIKCVLCENKDKRSNLRSLVRHGRETLKTKAAERIKLNDQKDRDLINRVFETNFEDIPGDPNVLYHKKCYNRIVNYRIPKGAKGILTKDEHPSTDSDRTTEVAATKLSRPVTRVSLIPWDKSLCIFCQKESSRETVLIMTIPVSENILNASKHNYIMRVRTAGISDLIAADAIYHNQCRVQFERRVEKAKRENKTSHKDLCFARLIDEITEGVSQGHVYTLLDVWHRYEQLLSELGETTGSYRFVLGKISNDHDARQLYQVVLSRRKC